MLYRFADSVCGLIATVFWVYEVEVDVTVDSNARLWHDNRAYRYIDQRATGSKPIVKITSVPVAGN